ncbi:MAG: xanthine dehydrogenase family protein molybdopterin-binding subunit [Acidisphaera sp.]|nr:xanthine dehydrogenase family protein molybdopterin-binding subunit [Acidisphaera sp.]
MGANAFGQPLTRKEDARFLTGRGRYTAEIVLPGQSHAVMLRSPHAHARILSIETRAAAQAPGVLAVLTGDDWSADRLGGIPPGESLIRLFGTPEGQGYSFRPPPRPPLARDKVRHVGDTVAMVVAETLAEARDAAELIEVEYEPLPAGTDTASAIGAPAVWDEASDNVCFRWSAGDGAAVEAAFSRAARIVRLNVVNNRIHVGALETRGALGEYDPASRRYTLHTGTQMPHGLKKELAEDLFGVAPDRLRVLVADVGGSFGIKNALYPEQALVLWAARRIGRPVGWIGERIDGFLSDYQARDNVSVGELALDGDGKILALRVRSLAAVGAYLAPEGQLSPTVNTPALAGVYRIPCIEVAVTGVFTNTAPTSVYRGAGRPEAVYVIERLIEQAARETGLDSLELRRRNLLHPSALPFRTGLGLVYDSGDFPAMLEHALARADHAGFAVRRAASAARGRLRGFGIAHYCERVAGAWGESGWVELSPDGRATVLTGTMSNGQGHETAFAQLVADRLGLDPADVDVVQGDTDRVPSGKGTGGSASLSIGGAALAEASDDLVRKALPLAAEALEAAPIDVAFAEGRFSIVGTDRSVGWRDLGRRLGPERLEGVGSWKPETPTFPNGCHIAEVEIDRETGHTSLVSYTMVHDFGRVLNPLLLEGQLQGGVAQGVGQAAMEHVVHDPVSGQVLSGSLMDYQLPRAADLPALTLETLATPAPSHPLGIKGCGEAGAAGGAPATINAILDALAAVGVAKLDMPATPERVWRAIAEGETALPRVRKDGELPPKVMPLEAAR